MSLVDRIRKHGSKASRLVAFFNSLPIPHTRLFSDTRFNKTKIHAVNYRKFMIAFSLILERRRFPPSISLKYNDLLQNHREGKDDLFRFFEDDCRDLDGSDFDFLFYEDHHPRDVDIVTSSFAFSFIYPEFVEEHFSKTIDVYFDTFQPLSNSAVQVVDPRHHANPWDAKAKYMFFPFDISPIQFAVGFQTFREPNSKSHHSENNVIFLAKLGGYVNEPLFPDLRANLGTIQQHSAALDIYDSANANIEKWNSTKRLDKLAGDIVKEKHDDEGVHKHRRSVSSFLSQHHNQDEIQAFMPTSNQRSFDMDAPYVGLEYAHRYADHPASFEKDLIKIYRQTSSGGRTIRRRRTRARVAVAGTPKRKR